MGSRENDTALWLHNKLGSTDDLWSGRSICSQINKDKLHDIIGCFRSLQPHVKVKLLLSFLHIIKRNVEEWKGDLTEILELAVADRDQWVSMTGVILKTFPGSFLVNTTDLSGSSTFHSMYTDLKKAVRRSGESHNLPLESVCLGTTAFATAIPHPPQTANHFTLKAEPKSTALRAELLAKSEELQSNTKKKGSQVGSVPMKIRSTAKRMDEEISAANHNSSMRNGGSNTGFLKANTLSSYSFAQRNTSSLAMRKEGGAKMLDISEMPPTGKEAKRRKKQEEQEAAAQAKKEKEEAAAAEKAAAAAKATPDYAAGLGTNTAMKTAMPRGPRPKTAVTTTPSYLPNITPRLPSTADGHYQPYYYHRYNYSMIPYYDRLNSAVYARELSSSATSPAIQSHTHRPVLHTAPVTQPTITVRPRAPAPSYQPRPIMQQPILRPPVQQQPVVHSAPATPIQPSSAAAPQSTKKPLSLTKEQMVEAQEMFKNSNKVTRPEKALILGFMAGSRENPCPQQGHIVNIRLSEKVEPVRLPDNSIREMLSETFFQMNYQTGEWRRIKKFKEAQQIGL